MFYFLRLCESSVLIVRRVTAGRRCLILLSLLIGCLVFFASNTLGSSNGERILPSHSFLPALHPIVLLEGCMVVMGVHCRCNLRSLPSQ